MLYELTMFGRYYGNQIINRWNYLSVGEPASVLGSFALMSAFGAIDTAGVYPTDAPLYLIRLGLVSAFTVETMVVRACAEYDVTDFYERPFLTPLPGIVSAEGLSPTQAIGFRTNRVRLDINRGTKRFAGVPETYTQGGGVITDATMGYYEDVAIAMSDVIDYDDEGSTISFAPVIVSKEAYTTPEGNTAYRYYDTLAEQLDHVAAGILWQPYTTTRDQDSRQYGRGV